MNIMQAGTSFKSHETVIQAWQVAWIKCRIPHCMDPSDTPLLFEPDENSAHLAKLEVVEGLLKIQNTNKLMWLHQ